MKYLIALAMSALLAAGCDEPAEGCDACISASAFVAPQAFVAQPAFVQSQVVAVPQFSYAVQPAFVQSFAVAPAFTSFATANVAVANVGCGARVRAFGVVRPFAFRSRAVASSGGLFGFGFLGGSRAVAVSR